MIASRGVRVLGAALFVGVFLAGGAAELAAQQQSGLFARNRNSKDPINIESDSLELRDKEKTATFINNVKLVQGDMTVECKVLVVHYDDQGPASTGSTGQKARPAAAASGQKQEQQIRLMEASGGVVVTQKDQVATGEKGVFDVKANTAVITGNVVLTQGQNVVRGDRLWVDLNTNLSRVESRKGADGRVQGLFLPRDQNKDSKDSKDNKDNGNKREAGPAHSEREKPKPPARPMKLN
jgi:lipopolysaccharide export system protein LptA